MAEVNCRPRSGCSVGEFEEEDRSAVSSEIVVFPNPTKGVLTVNIPKDVLANAQKIQVLDLAGNKLKEIALTGDSEVSIHMEGMLPGIYFIQVRGTDGVLGRAKFVYQP